MAERPEQRVSDYRIVRADYPDDFTAVVREAIRDGWQPMNKHGFSSTEEDDYIMEMVKMVDVDEYREMVFGLREEQWDADANEAYQAARTERDADTIMVPDNPPVDEEFFDDGDFHFE